MERDGTTPPQVLVSQPKVPYGLLVYIEAFEELDSERTHGMSLARIPWSAIVRYGHYYAMDVDELLFFVRRLDDAHLEHLASMRGGDNGGPAGAGATVQRPPRPD